VSATYLSFEVWTLVFLMYLALGLPCSMAARALETRLARSDKDSPHSDGPAPGGAQPVAPGGDSSVGYCAVAYMPADQSGSEATAAL